LRFGLNPEPDYTGTRLSGIGYPCKR